MPRLGCHLERFSPRVMSFVSTAKGSLAFAGYCWAGGYIEGLALGDKEGFFHIRLTPPGYRIKLFSGGVPPKISLAFWVYIGIPVVAVVEL